MDRATRLALNAINRSFYASIAAEWPEKRRTPWPGFARVVARLGALRTGKAPNSQPLRVLDLGAGDGRFAAYLTQTIGPNLDYVGVDASRALLDQARQRKLGDSFRFVEADFVATPPTAAIPSEAFDLIAVLGVLHHVPGHVARCELLRALADRIAQHGFIALTFWRLPDDPRFASRVVSWSTYNATAREPIAPEHLEAGDTLLRWGAGDAPPRYCHFPDAAETEALIAATGLTVVERFRADGLADRLNEYVLLTG